MMPKSALMILLLLALLRCAPGVPDAQQVLENAAATMGAANLQSIRYSGSGSYFNVGQSYSPGGPWPRYNANRYALEVDYAGVSLKQELVRTNAEGPLRGGRRLPGELRRLQFVKGNFAWNIRETGPEPIPAPAASAARRLQIWVTPHGFIQAAMRGNPAAESETRDGRTVTVISFTVEDHFKVSGTINEQNLVESVQTWMPNLVLGDMLVETVYSGYQDFNGVLFPTRIFQKQGGFPTLDINVNNVQPNAAARMEVPDSVRQATAAPPVQLRSQKLADGVWLLAGGGQNSVAVEFRDYVTVVEASISEQRSVVLIAEVGKLFPSKPIRYLVNTHHHFDHAGGIRAFVAEGITVVTQEKNRPFFERALQAPRTMRPDELSQTKTKAKFETVAEKHVLTDGERVVELHHIQGNHHDEAILMAYLPREKLLIEADVYAAARPGDSPPATADPFTVNFYDNIQRLKLDVDRIVPLHGRVVPLADLLQWLGKD